MGYNIYEDELDNLGRVIQYLRIEVDIKNAKINELTAIVQEMTDRIIFLERECGQEIN